VGCLLGSVDANQTETMQIFAHSTKSMAMAGALEEDQVPVMTMTIEDNDDNDSNDSNDKLGRNVNDDDDAMTDMAIPAGRNTT